MKLVSEIVFIVAIGVYSVVVTKIIPKKYYSFSNLLIATTAILYGLAIGLSLKQLGLSLTLLKNGLLSGLILSLPIFLIVMFIASSKKFRNHFSETPRKNYNFSTFIYEFLFRIPFGTALSEETIFRSVLLAILLSNHSHTTAIIVSSILFGFWHIFPTLHTIKTHDPIIEMMDNTRKRNKIAVIIAIMSTSLAGLIFALLTYKIGSFTVAWIVHSAINGFATLGGYLVVWHELRHQKV